MSDRPVRHGMSVVDVALTIARLCGAPSALHTIVALVVHPPAELGETAGQSLKAE